MKKEYLFAGITVILWGTLSSVSKLLIDGLTPMSVLFYSSAIASVTLLIINLTAYGPKLYQQYKKSDYGIICSLGFLGLFCYTALYYIGLANLTSQIACIINYMWPMMIIIFSCIILKEPFTPKTFLAILISFSGMALISIQGISGGFDGKSILGMAACFIAAICYGIYSVYNKKYDYNQWVVLHMAFTVTAVLSGLYCLVTKSFGTLTPMMFLGMLWIGIFVNAIAYVLWGIAVNTGNTAKISILAYFCPFLGVVFGRILLQEHIEPLAFAGLVLIIGGVLLKLTEKN